MGRHADPLSKSEALRQIARGRAAYRELVSLIAREHEWLRAGYSCEELDEKLREELTTLEAAVELLGVVVRARIAGDVGVTA